MTNINRRNFLKRAAAAASMPVVGAGCRFAQCDAAEFYPGWRKGEFDIHFIQTGVGEQTFFIFPDGTTLLLDCGDFYWEKWVDHTIPRRPSPERLGGEWVSRYVQRRKLYADRPFMKDVLPVQGHSVFKVAPGGKTFDAFVLTDEDESMRVLFARRFTSGAETKGV